MVPGELPAADLPLTEAQRKEHNKCWHQATALTEGLIQYHENQHMPAPNWWARWKLKQAVKLYLKVLELKPTNWAAMWMLGKTVQRLRDEQAAFGWFAKACDLKPGNADVAREASLSAMNLGLGATAIAYCEEALTIEPGNPGLLSNLALSQLLANRPQEALETVRDALESDPQDTVTAAVHRMIQHVLVSNSPCPRSSTELQDYWRRHGRESGRG